MRARRPAAHARPAASFIASSYYAIGGEITCQRCRTRIAAQWNRGSPGRRFAKAVGLGLAAAVVGASLHFGLAALTGYEFGLVAVLVGLLVRGAVRKGSSGRGGRRYQLLAVFLTYTAVVVTDSSLIARELLKGERAQADSVATETGLTTMRTARGRVIAVMWLVTSEGLLVLLGVAAAAIAGFGRAAEESDRSTLLQYVFLVGVLSLLTRVAAPAAGP